MIGYWARSKSSDKFMVTQVIKAHSDSKWCNDINIILQNLNMGEVFDAGFGDLTKFMTAFKSRLFDYGFKFLEEQIIDSSKCDLYSKFSLFEDIIILPNYLKYKMDNSSTCTLARFRCRNHRLLIERGSWFRPKLDKELRLCPTCKLIEDEFHFVLICPLYSTLREHYLKRKYWENPSLTKFVSLMNGSKSDLYQLSHFIRKGEELYCHMFGN